MVDDEPAVLRVVSRGLRQAGFPTLEASDGIEAVECIEADPERVGLVLTDVNMPEMDGLELARVVRERWRRIPIVLMSGRITREYVHGQAHTYPFLAKPFTVPELVAVVRDVLAH